MVLYQNGAYGTMDDIRNLQLALTGKAELPDMRKIGIEEVKLYERTKQKQIQNEQRRAKKRGSNLLE